MAPERLPTGSTPSNPNDPRSRAQVSYEGEDEFSAMSLDPGRRRSVKSAEKLSPIEPGAKKQVKVDELKPMNETGIVGFFRRIFAR